MLLKLKTEEEREGRKKNKSTYNIGRSSSAVVGLRIVTEIPLGKSNVVVKSALKISSPSPTSEKLNHGRPALPADHQSCFLKSCRLCSKNLRLDKDVYMYRGDQGFCSVECRDRQIFLDEMKELERSTEQMLASYRDCSNSGHHETRQLLEDLGGRSKSPHHHQNQNHWAIVS